MKEAGSAGILAKSRIAAGGALEIWYTLRSPPNASGSHSLWWELLPSNAPQTNVNQLTLFTAFFLPAFWARRVESGLRYAGLILGSLTVCKQAYQIRRQPGDKKADYCQNA
jgi:hypothetical protein